ncbi:MAG: hypothetical protein R3D34_17245 [Nitratireductor sp.]
MLLANGRRLAACARPVEMIEKHYASHIKNRIDTRAIDVRRASAR